MAVFLIMPQRLRENNQDVPAGRIANGCKASFRARFGKRFLATLGLMVLVAVFAVFGLYFFAHTMSYESTDDAFIEGHVTDVAPKIAGRIDKVFITDNQLVKKGDPIVEIDSRDYDAQLRQKQAALDSTEAQAARAAVDQQIANVKRLQATLDQDKADQAASQAQADQDADDLRREQDLYQQRVVSIEDFIRSRDTNRAAQANLDAAKMKVVSAEAQLTEGQAEVRSTIFPMKALRDNAPTFTCVMSSSILSSRMERL